MNPTVVNTSQIKVEHFRFYTVYLGRELGECIMEVHFRDAGHFHIEFMQPVPSDRELYNSLSSDDKELIVKSIYKELRIEYPPVPMTLHENWNGTLSYIKEGEIIAEYNVYKEKYRGLIYGNIYNHED